MLSSKNIRLSWMWDWLLMRFSSLLLENKRICIFRPLGLIVRLVDLSKGWSTARTINIWFSGSDLNSIRLSDYLIDRKFDISIYFLTSNIRRTFLSWLLQRFGLVSWLVWNGYDNFALINRLRRSHYRLVDINYCLWFWFQDTASRAVRVPRAFYLRVSYLLKNYAWLFPQYLSDFIIAIILVSVPLGRQSLEIRRVLLQLFNLLWKSIRQRDLTTLQLMCSNFSSVNTQPFPKLRNIPTARRSEVTEVSNNDSQILGISLAGQPEIDPFCCLRHIKLHIVQIVKVRIFF